MSYYYMGPDNQPAGPASLEEIRALSRLNPLVRDPLVRPEDSGDWRLLSSYSTTGGVGAAGGRVWLPPPGTLLSDAVGDLLHFLSRVMSPGLLQHSIAFAKRFGHYAVMAGAVLTVLYALYAAIRFESFSLLLLGLVLVVVIAVAQFAAGRFLDAADRVIANTPSRISSPAFLECTGLILALLAVVVLIGGIGAAINVRSFAVLLPPLLGSIVLAHLATMLLHPETVNVQVGEGSAGEEAIGILTTFFKAGLKLLPLFFFLLAVVGGLALLAGFFGDRASTAVAAGVAALVPGALGALPYGLVGSGIVVFACLVPLLGYFVFLLQYLILDVLRAILAVPAKLDALRR